MSGAFSRIPCPLTKQRKHKNCCKSISLIKWMTDPPPAQTSIHWTINCVWCWRNVPTHRGTKILTHWRQREKFSWPWFVSRSLTGLNICGTVCKQNAVNLSTDNWIVIFEVIFKFLANFVSICFVFASKFMFKVRTELMTILGIGGKFYRNCHN